MFVAFTMTHADPFQPTAFAEAGLAPLMLPLELPLRTLHMRKNSLTPNRSGWPFTVGFVHCVDDAPVVVVAHWKIWPSRI